MSNPESISDENGKSNYNYSLASQYALRVALQTMKERCLSLQQRLSSLEGENQMLRNRLNIDPDAFVDNEAESAITNETDLEKLKQHNLELSKQKSQLNEHIQMVANENRKLWSRLSQIAKEKSNHNYNITNEIDTNENSQRITVVQNLIRSRTFTQHSPNPKLRHKIKSSDNLDKDVNELSLEEITLNTSNDSRDNLDENDHAVIKTCENSLGFCYFNNDGITETDLSQEAKKCIDGLVDIKKQLLQQQNDLRVALSSIHNKFVLKECADCVRKNEKPETADKSLETDDSITEMKGVLSAQSSIDKPNTHLQTEPFQLDPNGTNSSQLDLLEQKRLADENDKMCPLCGRIYNSLTPFDYFQEHVESHFIDDSEVEPSLERNFEFISHTVGDF